MRNARAIPVLLRRCETFGAHSVNDQLDWDVEALMAAIEATGPLAEILERVERGESVTITREGKPVAQLVPVHSPQERDHLEAIRELREFGKGRHLDGVTLRELIDEGRRH
jgi:prevent-host-death family protein